MRRRTVVLLKGYPRLSETFIAQEIKGLEDAGLDLVLMSMRHPTDERRHPVHDEIRAPVVYLPEYLHDEPSRVLSALMSRVATPGFWRALGALAADLPRDFSRNRLRRFGQALVLAAEWPRDAGWLHSHFIHTPAAVARYAALMLDLPWTCSAHAKDIWTSPDWDLEDKLASARWVVTCTQAGHERLQMLSHGHAPVHLSYHGLDLSRFAPMPTQRASRDGTNADDPVLIASVGRAVEKKGYDVLLRALARLYEHLHWRFEHVGGGEHLGDLKRLADELEIADRITWHGALAQEAVLALYRRADLFALACRVAADGDRDGLPNVLVEASSQALCTVSTRAAAVTELLVDGENALLVEPDDPEALAHALARAITDPALRRELGSAAEARVRQNFDYRASVRQLVGLFEREWEKA